tara:strand:- start:1028 stop:1261 length:234 start_codon:yes stop_codon:yes gene_type:complete
MLALVLVAGVAALTPEDDGGPKQRQLQNIAFKVFTKLATATDFFEPNVYTASSIWIVFTYLSACVCANVGGRQQSLI